MVSLLYLWPRTLAEVNHTKLTILHEFLCYSSRHHPPDEFPCWNNRSKSLNLQPFLIFVLATFRPVQNAVVRIHSKWAERKVTVGARLPFGHALFLKITSLLRAHINTQLTHCYPKRLKEQRGRRLKRFYLEAADSVKAIWRRRSREILTWTTLWISLFFRSGFPMSRSMTVEDYLEVGATNYTRDWDVDGRLPNQVAYFLCMLLPLPSTSMYPVVCLHGDECSVTYDSDLFKYLSCLDWCIHSTHIARAISSGKKVNCWVGTTMYCWGHIHWQEIVWSGFLLQISFVLGVWTCTRMRVDSSWWRMPCCLCQHSEYFVFQWARRIL